LPLILILNFLVYKCDGPRNPSPSSGRQNKTAKAGDAPVADKADKVIAAAGEMPVGLRLDGGFVQYQNGMMRWNWQWGPGGKPYPIDWQAVLRAARYPDIQNKPKAGLMMNTMVIKRLATPKSNQPIPSTQPDSDWEFYRADTSDSGKLKDAGPTEEILSYADVNHIDVYVGLWEDEQFTYSKLNEEYLRAAAEKNKQLAKKVWPLLRGHTSFKGWYIPNEMWNIRAGDMAKARLLHNFLASISSYCRHDIESDPSFRDIAARKSVAVAPFFDPDVNELHSPAGEVKEVYSTILNGSGVDVLMLQDRVGVLGWGTVASHLEEYFAAFRDACKSVTPEVGFWAVVEVFRPGAQHAEPYDGSHLKEQLCVETGYASKTIAFDYYHYMNPVVPDAGAPGETAVIGSLGGRRQLYDYYKSNFIDNDVPPSGCPRPAPPK
jgi:hypothetical protein